MGYNQELGERGEKVAVSRLLRAGHEIIVTNYRCSLGELDIVSVCDEILVITEVKTRAASSRRYGLPCEAVSHSKIKKLARMTSVFLGDHKYPQSVKAQEGGIRYDVVEVTVDNYETICVSHLEDAFRL